MRAVNRWTLGTAFAVLVGLTAFADSGPKFFVTDDCQPGPAGGWNSCLRETGEVSQPEFAAANANRYPGHPSWRIDPPYVAVQNQNDIRAANTGGRGHTFTEVARFGGGFVAGLNPPGATPAPECAIVNADGTLRPAPAAAATTVAPGSELRVEGLTPGTHHFQCCIHPWMRTTVNISAADPQH